jgi:periplasmic divalent cation tolerance protein
MRSANVYCVILVTAGSPAEAKRIGRALLKKRLVACVNVLPGVASHYWWKGRIERSRECLMMMKTRRGRFAAIERMVKQLHSYAVPEIIALPMAAGQRDYLRWVDASLSGR